MSQTAPAPARPAIAAVGIVAKEGIRAADTLRDLTDWLGARGIAVVLDEGAASLDASREARAVTRTALPKQVDLVIALGGDGTLLSIAGRIAEAGRDIPILGVNFGSLGFLTEIRLDELPGALTQVLAGEATIDDRLMLLAEATRQGKAETHVVLNDVVFSKPSVSRIIGLTVRVGTALVTEVRADGLIVASPTGSTAYNLAAGGPIVHPAVDALILTPIAPHMLTNRPLVLPGATVVDVEPTTAEVYVTYDGQSGNRLQFGDRVRIRRAPHPLRLVKAPARSYFDVLREKLKWGAR